jgi:hypothetical protein
VEEEDDDDFDWPDDDGPDPEEVAAWQWAIVELFESQNKLQDDAPSREEDNDAWVHHGVEHSLRKEQPQREGDETMNEHRRLLVMLCRERR